MGGIHAIPRAHPTDSCVRSAHRTAAKFWQEQSYAMIQQKLTGSELYEWTNSIEKRFPLS